MCPCRSVPLVAAASNLTLDSQLMLEQHHEALAQRPLFVVTDRFEKSLPELCRQCLDWLPAGRERMLLTSGWSPYPPDHLQIFEMIRTGCGFPQSLGATPGHLFLSTKQAGTHYEDRPAIDVSEESIAMWLMGLMQEWTWEGYAFVQGCRDVIVLGDGYLRFLSIDFARLDEAEALVGEWGLKARATFPWA